MRAMVIHRILSLAEVEAPLEQRELPTPDPGPGEIRIKVSACGVCHTELDEIEGRTAPPRLPVVPGHEVVGKVDQVGTGATRFAAGDRVGVGWIHSSSGSDDENLSPRFRATGRDLDGGYAQDMTVPEGYAHPIPAVFSDAEAAPLLCAGAVGYRSLRLTGIQDGASLGLTGFGGSAHLVLQLARHLYPRSQVFVFARSRGTRLRVGARRHLGRRHGGALAHATAGRHRHDAGLEAHRRSARQPASRRAPGNQRHPQGGRRQGLSPAARLPGSPLARERDRIRSQRDATRHRRIPAHRRPDPAAAAGRDLPAGRGQPRPPGTRARARPWRQGLACRLKTGFSAPRSAKPRGWFTTYSGQWSVVSGQWSVARFGFRYNRLLANEAKNLEYTHPKTSP